MGDGSDMVEYHVDDGKGFHERMQTTKFGGNLSVRRNNDDRPLVMFGQDEEY